MPVQDEVQSPDDAMVADAMRGDVEALDRLFRRYYPSVVQSVFRFAPDVDAAQDIAQEAFLRALQNVRQLTAGTRFGPWLVRIARNIAVDRARRQRVRPEVELSEPDEVVDRGATESRSDRDPGHVSRVWHAIQRLPDRERRLMLLYYGRGMTIEQTARECRIRASAVKIGLHRGRCRVRELVGA